MESVSFVHAASPLKTHYGNSVFHCFSYGIHEEQNVLCIEVCGGISDPLVRIQSACYTAEIFRSTDCDCHEQLDESLRRIHEEGGYFIYMLADGRGAGLLVKTQALALFAEEGVDTYDAYERLAVPPDPRNYSLVVPVLKYFKLQRIRLLTNNPRKLAGIEEGGISVTHEALQIPPTADSRPYLETKRLKFGHIL